MEHEEEKKKSSAAAKKYKDKKFTKKRKRAGFDSNVIESREESFVEYRQVKKNCILHGKCSHSTEKCKVLHAIMNKA